jgi:hypothetical protein
MPLPQDAYCSSPELDNARLRAASNAWHRYLTAEGQVARLIRYQHRTPQMKQDLTDWSARSAQAKSELTTALSLDTPYPPAPPKGEARP